jgi:hypothetical protein
MSKLHFTSISIGLDCELIGEANGNGCKCSQHFIDIGTFYHNPTQLQSPLEDQWKNT